MEETIWLTIIKLLAVVLLVFANGFFVAAEFALISVRRTRIVELVAEGNAAARWAHRAITDPDQFIAATQLGITISSLGLGWLGEPAIAHLLEPLICLFPGVAESELPYTLSVALSFALITFLHVVVGELMPKSIALQHPERTSLIVARPTILTEMLFKPMIWLLNGTGNLLLKLVGFTPAPEHEIHHSAEELKMLVHASTESGMVEDAEGMILSKVFGFGEILVRQVMIPRTEMIAVAADANLDDIIQTAMEQPYTKLPVYENDLDHILGVLHLKDILRSQYAANPTHHRASDLMRETIFIPETARIATLLSRFRVRKQHLAIVLDEYGGTAGVVTLEDLLEEIIGEIQDPFDEIPQIQIRADGSSLIDGLTPIEDINEHFDLSLNDPYYDTIAGYMLGHLGRLAQAGDQVAGDKALLTVEAMDGKRIARISIKSQDSADSADPSISKNS